MTNVKTKWLFFGTQMDSPCGTDPNFSYILYMRLYCCVYRYVTELELEVRTGVPDGLVSWLGLDLAQEDYLGLGIDDGLVKVK